MQLRNFSTIKNLNSKSNLIVVIKILITIAILINIFGMFFPLLTSSFSPYYGTIAKNIVLSNNWTDLILNKQDWLDKPHFPFWITAISFKIFGIHSFSYILPGMLFHLLGAFYTYKLAKYWYSEGIAYLSVLFYLTAFHLMISSIDVRAEAYLVGEIIPACYYWLNYDNTSKIKYLILGAFFTALAMMTKGIFVLITIISGIASLWIYRKEWKNFISIKWISALLLSLIFILPELVSLYYQFDLHPEKIVFEHNNVSGIKWFFWDSQFGRFFNTGPIRSTYFSVFQYFSYIHIFLWAFLPWFPIFFMAVWSLGTKCKDKKIVPSQIYFFSSFFVTFLLFSLTSFQVDHYTNIIFPFASIICAKWLIDIFEEQKYFYKAHIVFNIEVIITTIVIIFIFIMSYFTLNRVNFVIISALVLLAIMILFYRKLSWQIKVIAYPSITICILFILATMINGIGYAKYDAGYQIFLYLNKEQKLPIISYKIDYMKLLSLDLYSQNGYEVEDNLEKIKDYQRPFYLVSKKINQNELEKQFKTVKIIGYFYGINIRDYIFIVINPHSQDNIEKLDQYVVMRIN